LSGNAYDKGILEVKLVSVPWIHFRWIEGSDSFFEIYRIIWRTPIVIQGAGAGQLLLQRESFGDILRLSDKG
jgi:hypothetical protein